MERFNPETLKKIIPSLEAMLPFGIWITDKEGKLIYVSSSFLDMVQMTFEDARDYGWSSRMPAENIEPTLKKWEHTVKNLDFWDHEHAFYGKDQVYYVLSRGYKINIDGEAYWIGINLDMTEKKTTYLQVKELKDKYEELMNRVEDSHIQFDRDWNIKYISKSGLDFLKKGPELIGKNVFEEFPWLKDSEVEKNFKKCLDEQVEVRYVYHSKSMNKYFKTKLFPSPEGVAFFATEVTGEVTAKNRMKELLDEKELLLREVHHRNKNNFQLLLSLLNLQANNFDDPLLKAAFMESWRRINSLGLLYDQLYSNEFFNEVNIRKYVVDLINSLKRTFLSGDSVDIQADVEELNVNHSFAVSLGLIINELLANSLKHAFTLSRRGTICVSIKLTGPEQLKIVVKDDGRGIHDSHQKESLGFLIIENLAEQHSGTFKLENNNGTTATIEMKFA